MSDMSIEQEIIAAVHKLSDEQKQRVLEIARSLGRPKGTPGKLAVQYAREIGFSSQDLAEMEQAINEAFETPVGFNEVDLDE